MQRFDKRNEKTVPEVRFAETEPSTVRLHPSHYVLLAVIRVQGSVNLPYFSHTVKPSMKSHPMNTSSCALDKSPVGAYAN